MKTRSKSSKELSFGGVNTPSDGMTFPASPFLQKKRKFLEFSGTEPENLVPTFSVSSPSRCGDVSCEHGKPKARSSKKKHRQSSENSCFSINHLVEECLALVLSFAVSNLHEIESISLVSKSWSLKMNAKV